MKIFSKLLQQQNLKEIPFPLDLKNYPLYIRISTVDINSYNQPSAPVYNPTAPGYNIVYSPKASEQVEARKLF